MRILNIYLLVIFLFSFSNSVYGSDPSTITFSHFKSVDADNCLEAMSFGKIIENHIVQPQDMEDHYFEDRIVLVVFEKQVYEARLYLERNGALKVYCGRASR
jgi:hypothetical protein